MQREIVNVVKNEIYIPLWNFCSHVINLRFKCEYFPDKLRMIRVEPIFKMGNVDDCSNYRPVPILTAMTKIFDAVIHIPKKTPVFHNAVYG